MLGRDSGPPIKLQNIIVQGRGWWLPDSILYNLMLGRNLKPKGVRAGNLGVVAVSPSNNDIIHMTCCVPLLLEYSIAFALWLVM